MPKKTAKPKTGRPFLGHTEAAMTRLTTETSAWLEAVQRRAGIRKSDMLRLIIEDARARGWSPG